MIFMGLGAGGLRRKEVVYRHRMDRAPTTEDRDARIGYEGFVEMLQEEGWVSSDGDTTLKNFRWSYGSCTEPGNNYIEWKAVEILMH
mgnify:CR=1 FL=1|jgi:hypothetical protein|tara:strand:- start:7695 stop:7955 length:261 start_codon:yes stop_codon:yes gene_type:complete